MTSSVALDALQTNEHCVKPVLNKPRLGHMLVHTQNNNNKGKNQKPKKTNDARMP